MSDRIGDYRDPFWNARDKRIRKAHLDAIAATGRINDLNADIASKRRAEYLQTCLDDVYRERATVLVALATVTAPGKGEWAERLEAITLTRAPALDELDQLRQDVERLRRMFTYTPRGPGLDDGSINPVLLRMQWEEEERAARSRDYASQFDPVIAGLGSMIDAVRRYVSARD